MPIESKTLEKIMGYSLGGFTGFNVFESGRKFINYISPPVDPIRDLIYSKVAEIPPELIQQVAEISDYLSRNDLKSGIIHLVLVGVTGVPAGYLLRKANNKQSE